MTLYLVGNFFGRLAVSYGLVWLAMLLIAKLDWRQAFKKTHRWYGLASVVIVLLLGIASAVLKEAA